MTQQKSSRLISYPISLVKARGRMCLRRVIIQGIYSLLDSRALSYQAVPRRLHLKDTRIQAERNFFCRPAHQDLKLDWMGQHLVLLSWLIAITHQRLKNWSCFLKQIPVNSMLMRFNALGLNRGVKDASIKYICWSIHPDSRFRLKGSRLNIADKRIKNNIYSSRRIHSRQNLCIFKRIVSRTSGWDRDNSQFRNNIYHRHEAGVGR